MQRSCGEWSDVWLVCLGYHLHLPVTKDPALRLDGARGNGAICWWFWVYLPATKDSTLRLEDLDATVQSDGGFGFTCSRPRIRTCVF